MTTRELVARRALGDLKIWPGDRVHLLDTGEIEVRRTLAPFYGQALKRAEARGDLRPVAPHTLTEDTPNVDATRMAPPHPGGA